MKTLRGCITGMLTSGNHRVVKRRLLLLIEKMELPDADTPIARFTEELTECNLALSHRRMVGKRSIHVRIAPGHQRRSARRTLRVLGKRILEPHTRTGQSIDMRRPDRIVSVTSDTVSAQLIRKDQNDILVGDRAGCARRGVLLVSGERRASAADRDTGPLRRDRQHRRRSHRRTPRRSRQSRLQTRFRR